ncbi:MAG: glycosyltransferase [Myxococcota bacterium]
MELTCAIVEAVAVSIVLLASTPVVSGIYQFALVGLSVLKTHLDRSGNVMPRVSVVVPAWNEVAVIGATIERLMKLNYPADRLRVYVVDDASDDGTPEAVLARAEVYPGRVFHVRREAGGEGKAHTLNYGLRVLWQSDWTQAVLIMDADVIFTADSLLQMARHLADPKVGAVTAYIKEGSAHPNYVQRFVGFEYITATAAARRAQNVLGFLACLSGGAQLHTRENLLAIGGEIFSDTLAEDTFTTFRTQLEGRIALFEPNAIVYAEEPDGLVGLWKQRLRWARGNVQITQAYASLWFNRRRHPTLGSPSMAILWFSIFLMPIFQLFASAGLLTLYVLDPSVAWQLFRVFWILAGVAYLLVLFISLAIDTESAKRTWAEGVMFPGFVALILIVGSLIPPVLDGLFGRFPELEQPIVLLAYAWPTLSMVLAWGAKEFEARNDRLRWLPRWMLYIVGYGPFLSAVTFAAYVAEMRGASLAWDKTVKTGKVSN